MFLTLWPHRSSQHAYLQVPAKVGALWKEWDQKAQKNGLRHQVFAVNGDHYVGEWKDNVKHGKWGLRGECGVWATVDPWGQGSSLQSSLGT